VTIPLAFPRRSNPDEEEEEECCLGMGVDTTQKGSNVTDSKSHTVHLQVEKMAKIVHTYFTVKGKHIYEFT